jgi:hypothetical protein
MYAFVAVKALPVHQLDGTPAGGSRITVPSQRPLVHAAAAPQARLQRPQFVASVAMFVSQSVGSPPQSAVPAGHEKTPPSPESPPASVVAPPAPLSSPPAEASAPPEEAPPEERPPDAVTPPLLAPPDAGAPPLPPLPVGVPPLPSLASSSQDPAEHWVGLRFDSLEPQAAVPNATAAIEMNPVRKS